MPVPSANTCAYTALFTLDTEEEMQVNLEERGWADKELLARVRRFTLIPRFVEDALPILICNIPAGAKPVFKMRVKGVLPLGGNGDVRLEDLPRVRSYGLGYKKGRTEYLTWVAVNGIVEIGEDPTHAEVVLSQMQV